jgi:hypothetical protein
MVITKISYFGSVGLGQMCCHVQFTGPILYLCCHFLLIFLLILYPDFFIVCLITILHIITKNLVKYICTCILLVSLPMTYLKVNWPYKSFFIYTLCVLLGVASQLL